MLKATSSTRLVDKLVRIHVLVEEMRRDGCQNHVSVVYSHHRVVVPLTVSNKDNVPRTCSSKL